MFTYHLFPYFMYQSEQRHLKQCMCLLVHFAENLSVGHGRKIFNRHKTLRMPVFHLFHSVATIFPVGMKVKPHRICEHQLSARTIEYFSYRIRNPVPKIPAPICPNGCKRGIPSPLPTPRSPTCGHPPGTWHRRRP